MSQEKFRTWDDYFIPGTTVLRNKFNETDPMKLGYLENFHSAQRLQELAQNPIPGQFDHQHMKAIHRHIFQDVYEWAGEQRTGPIDGPMVKKWFDLIDHEPGSSDAPFIYYSYYPADKIDKDITLIYQRLGKDNHLVGLDRETFTVKLADYWNKVNVVHAFREGNTRSQFAFFHQLSRNAGYQLDLDAFKIGSPLRDELVNARFYGVATHNPQRLQAALSKAIQPNAGDASVTADASFVRAAVAAQSEGRANLTTALQAAALASPRPISQMLKDSKGKASSPVKLPDYSSRTDKESGLEPH